MTDIALAAIGIFLIGIVVGIIYVDCRAIRREQRRYQQARRFREEHGIWHDPDAPGHHFLPDEAPDGVSHMFRGVNGLYVRHLPTVRSHDEELAVRA